MRNKNIDDFLDGKLTLEQLTNTLEKNSIEKQFIESYQKVIEENNSLIPDFNPFEKLEAKKNKRISFAKRLLPYAATVLLFVSSFFVYQNYHSKKMETMYSEQELLEIKKNTEMALLHFSKELNACLAKFEDAKKMQEPLNEIKSLKDINIDI